MYTKSITKEIFILKIPFEDLTTTVYFYRCGEGVAIIDCATYLADVDNYILPALEELKIKDDTVKYLLLTHSHGDHAGGIKRLAEVFPNATIGATFETGLKNQIILEDNERILGDLVTVFLPGHTENSVGFFDTATKTLLSGDCLQLEGIGKYKNNVANLNLYEKSILKLKNMDIKCIVAAHEFEPLGSIAEGELAVEKYLDYCKSVYFN